MTKEISSYFYFFRHIKSTTKSIFFFFQQFGVSLKFINQNSPCLNYIPPIVRKCVDSLSITGVIDTEGIFRRSGNYSKVVELKQKVNDGNDVDFKDVDTHVIAGLLKTFLRDLEEPLLTYELYDEITSFLGRLNMEMKPSFMFVRSLFFIFRISQRREIAKCETNVAREAAY